jgi:hypothetical protein
MAALSPVALQSALAQQTSEVWLVLLTLSHPSLSDSLRFVNDYASHTSGSDIYIAFPFEIEFPSADPDSIPEARINIDNIDRSVVKSMRSFGSAPTVTIEVVLASQPSIIEASYTDMTLRDVHWDVQSIGGVLRFEDLSTEPVSVQMTPARFPGCF